MKACIYCDRLLHPRLYQQHIEWHLGTLQDNDDDDEEDEVIIIEDTPQTSTKATQTDLFPNKGANLNRTSIPSRGCSKRKSTLRPAGCEPALLSEAVWNQTFDIYKATTFRYLSMEATSLQHFSKLLTDALNKSVAGKILTLDTTEKLEAKFSSLKSNEYGAEIDGLVIHVKTASSQTLLCAVFCNIREMSYKPKSTKDPFNHCFPLALIKSAAPLFRSLDRFLSATFDCTLTPAMLTSDGLKIEFTYLLDWCQELELTDEELVGRLRYKEKDVEVNLTQLLDHLQEFLDISNPKLESSEVEKLFSFIQSSTNTYVSTLKAIDMPQALIRMSGKVKIFKQEYVPAILEDLQKLFCQNF